MDGEELAAVVTPFAAWVAKAVQDVSGIPAHAPCGSQRKRVLTCVKTGVVACQVVIAHKRDAKNQATTQGFAVVVTNVIPFTRKRA